MISDLYEHASITKDYLDPIERCKREYFFEGVAAVSENELRKETVYPGERFLYVYRLAISYANIGRVLGLNFDEDFESLENELDYFEMEAVPFIDNNKMESCVFRFMKSIVAIRGSLENMIENWIPKDMHIIQDVRGLTDEENELYLQASMVLNLANALCLKDCEDELFNLADNLYCAENHHRFKSPDEEKVSAIKGLEKDINTVIVALCKYLLT